MCVTKSTNRLSKAQRAYNAGQFSTVKDLAQNIVADDQVSDSDKKEALQLLNSIGIDPASTLVFGVTALLMLFLAIKYVL